jgi:carbonyl reductase 1
LLARNETCGLNSVEELKKENILVNFHQLDISDQDSIDKFALYLKEKHGGLDVLVNNAGVFIEVFKQLKSTHLILIIIILCSKKNKERSQFGKEASHTVHVNFNGPFNVCQALFPLLRPGARVVNTVSRMGLFKAIKSESYRARLHSPDLTIEEILQMVKTYIEYLI